MRDTSYSFFFQAEDGIRDYKVTGVQTCALPISRAQATPGPAPPRPTSSCLHPHRSRRLPPLPLSGGRPSPPDRKSTRLNSSHLVISYAVFCLKKKNYDPTDCIGTKTPSTSYSVF